MNFPIKSIRKRGITLVPTFICRKIIYYLGHDLCFCHTPPPPPHSPTAILRLLKLPKMLLFPMSSPALKTWNKNTPIIIVNCEIFGNLGWFYRFSWQMAAILEFSSIFRGQILIDCHSLHV